MQETSGRVTIDASIFYRRQVRRRLAATAWNLQLELDVKENRRLLGSEFRIAVRGPGDAVDQFLKWADNVQAILCYGD